jgi:2-oxoglutarate ferredoxin oxidoreductase subunit delta
MARGKIEVDESRCKGCGLCVEFCPSHTIELSEDLNPIGHHPARMHDPEKCTACAICADMCPEGGITVYRQKRGKNRG